MSSNLLSCLICGGQTVEIGFLYRHLVSHSPSDLAMAMIRFQQQTAKDQQATAQENCINCKNFYQYHQYQSYQSQTGSFGYHQNWNNAVQYNQQHQLHPSNMSYDQNWNNHEYPTSYPDHFLYAGCNQNNVGIQSQTNVSNLSQAQHGANDESNNLGISKEKEKEDEERRKSPDLKPNLVNLKIPVQSTYKEKIYETGEDGLVTEVEKELMKTELVDKMVEVKDAEPTEWKFWSQVAQKMIDHVQMTPKVNARTRGALKSNVNLVPRKTTDIVGAENKTIIVNTRGGNKIKAFRCLSNQTEFKSIGIQTKLSFESHDEDLLIMPKPVEPLYLIPEGYVEPPSSNFVGQQGGQMPIKEVLFQKSDNSLVEVISHPGFYPDAQMVIPSFVENDDELTDDAEETE